EPPSFGSAAIISRPSASPGPTGGRDERGPAGGGGSRARTAARASRGLLAAPLGTTAGHPPVAKSSGRRRGDSAPRRLRRRVLGFAEQSQQDDAGGAVQHRSSHDRGRPRGSAARLCRRSPRSAPARAAIAG